MSNKLISEQSPYLLQHAHNPVAWYPWGDEAFELAKATNKPVIVSIGYAACHWCHVMERESFEDEATAAYMNEHFVCVKVDREEHPDVDHMYMDAVQAIAGNGGWPLNVFVTPDRVPFYGGTYYPPRPAYSRPSWMQLMQRMIDIWEKQNDEVMAQADQMVAYLKQASQKTFAKTENTMDKSMCREIAESLLKQADTEQGGFGNAPKFPGTMAISFLLEHYHFTGYEPALKHALHSLDAMVAGGIYDQLGGGFARYSTDRQWLAPHFEKMLYDNALLISSLCDAYSITKDVKYKTIIEETIAFAERELKDSSGGYYCALDADSEGVEGKFYTWTWNEWVAVAGSDDAAVMAHFGVKPEGNWEETNILHVAQSIEETAKEYNEEVTALTDRIAVIKEKLLAVRTQRMRPQTDDKSLLSWNALMNISLTKAGVVLQQKQYLERAAAHMDWMLQAFEQDGGLLHTWKNGHARITAKLDDYAYLVQALLQLASATGNNNFLLKSKDLLETVSRDFGTEGGFFYFTSVQQQDIPVRKTDLYDGATPSANAVMAHNLWLSGMCFERTEWTEQAWLMIQNMSDSAVRYSYSFSYWGIMAQRYAQGLKTVIISGENAEKAASEMRESYFPESFCLTLGKDIFNIPPLGKKFFDGKLYIFVCTEQACLSPVSSVGEAFSLLRS